ncbi:MAG: phytanoyl-CoA dioxygenase family protein [Chitinophagales bacterium]|nr:phytanoyl-CoA dioxygenase family protein [Chitinophagales bacterium]
MLATFRNILKIGFELPISDGELVKYNQDFFLDKSIQDELKQKGYAVRNLLQIEQIDNLKTDFFEILKREDSEIKDLFWNSGRPSSVVVRNMAKESVYKYVRPYLEQFFLPDQADLMGGVFVVKPPTDKSELNPHQDSSHVEEDQYMSVYAWCPLQDVTVNNGALHVVPGSHRFGNTQRSLNVPWQFDSYLDLLWKYSIPVEMKAGEVVFFDSATIHCSPANFSEQYRIAVNFFIKQKKADFLHYYVGDETSKGKVEKFLVDMSFFYDKEFEKRPTEEYPKKGEEVFKNLKLNSQKVEAWCRIGAGFI